MPPLLLLGLAWLAGLALARLPDPRLPLLWLAGAAPLVLLHRRRLPLPWSLALLALLAAALGLGRGLPPPPPAPPPLPAGITAVRASIADWPRRYETAAGATLSVQAVRVGGAWRPFGATLDARLPLYPAVVPGDLIEATGRPRPPDALTDRRTADRLRRAGLAGQLWARDLIVLQPAAPDGPGAWRAGVVAALTGALDRHLPAPAAGLAAGVLLGQRGGLSVEVRDAFVRTGTIHLLVVSGWNMTLVVAFVGWVGARLRARHHPLWPAAALAGIAGYTLLVGADPPVVRAALMGGLAVVALATGRRADPLVALATAAAVMAGLDPALLGDLSFQLSGLATLGLVLALPALAPWLERLPRPARWPAEALAGTVAAQLAVEPLLAATYGRVSLLAPAVNLPVAPLVPPVMLGGLLVAGLGWLGLPLLPDLAALLTLAAAAPLLAIVTTAARLPVASLAVPAPPPAVVLALYALLALAALPLATPQPAATVRHAAAALRRVLPAASLAGLAVAAGVVWLLVLGGGR